MIDPRFYEFGVGASASSLALAAGATLVRGNPDAFIRSLAQSDQAGPEDLSFLESDKSGAAMHVQAGACLAPPGMAAAFPDGVAVLETSHPRAAFAAVATRLVTLRRLGAEQAHLSQHASIASDAVIEPGAVIGSGASIGAGSRIGANTVIGPGVQIGKGVQIGPNVSIACALIGDHVTILAGVRIGETGFGLAGSPSGAVLTPHMGRVIIQDRVTIGANSTVDRGIFGDTVIGEKSHIDNLCHVAHNVRLGAHVVMAAYTGIAGSSTVGDGVMFGGRVGIADHVNIGAGARLAAAAAVMRDVPAGETHGGYPAKPMRTWMRELAWLAQQAQKRPGKDN